MVSCTKRTVLCVMAALCLCVSAFAQDAVKRGQEIFNQTCTGYCHATNGGGGGSAPRLAGRGFDQAYINNVVNRGVPGTVMPPFAMTLSRADLNAVVAFVASLNGVVPAAQPTPAAIPTRPLSPDAAHGKDLFYDATRSFGRCSTCHEVNGVGIPVAGPISKVPANAQALKTIATPLVSTVVMNGDTMPALVVSKTTRNVIFYDLTVPPPVLVTSNPADVKLSDGSSWRHASVIGSYTDGELDSILAFLKSVN